MSRLRPTLWRTCRVLACETRLKMLRALFDEGELCVSEMAKRVGISAHNASTQLRALNARGLITPRRVKQRVLYRAEANEELDDAPQLLSAVRDAFARKTPIADVFHLCTAFTHARRIELVQILSGGPRRFSDLQKETHLPYLSLREHLNKLVSRRFVKQEGHDFHLCTPRDPLRRTLLAAAVTEK